jgi:hypothetical protein
MSQEASQNMYFFFIKMATELLAESSIGNKRVHTRNITQQYYDFMLYSYGLKLLMRGGLPIGKSKYMCLLFYERSQLTNFRVNSFENLYSSISRDLCNAFSF